MMNNFTMPMQLINMLKSGNPQEIAMNLLQQRCGDNPMIQNITQMVQSGDIGGVEQIARNLCRERGIDPDQMMNDVKSRMG